MVTADTPIATRPRQGRNRFFIAMALLMLVAVALGFGKSFYVRPMFSDKPLPIHLVVHGITMTAWYLLFLAQASLVAVGRTDLHRRLGLAGVVLALAVVVTGVIVNVRLVPRMEALGILSGADGLRQGAGFALGSLLGLALFAVVVALALLWRRRPAVHKRLMFWACVLTVGPAFANTRPLGQALDPLVAPHLPFFPSDLFWFAALMAYDWVTLRRFHPATYVTFLVLAAVLIGATGPIAGNAALQDWFLAVTSAR